MLSQDWSKIKAPAPYEPGEPAFWNDPHIAGQMLSAHLSQDTEAASYRGRRIDAICAFLPHAMGLPVGGSIMDLGCGPGLYCKRLAAVGYNMTGLDLSANSIAYARSTVPGVDFRVGSYLEWQEEARYDAVFLIYEDFGVLPPADRRLLLANIRRALRPDGTLALDGATVSAFARLASQPQQSWQIVEDGFWRPHRHIVLEQLHLYPEIPSTCRQYIVYDGAVTVYRVHQTYYTPEALTQELEAAGFAVENVLAGLDGGFWQPDGDQIGIICRKVE